MTGLLPILSERAPKPRLVAALVTPKTETTNPIWVKEVIRRTSLVNREESPRWMPQTAPERNSTKRRPATIHNILSRLTRIRCPSTRLQIWLLAPIKKSTHALATSCLIRVETKTSKNGEVLFNPFG
jgi:hypothetical protein